MSEGLLSALQELFVGQILKHLDGKNLGVRIHRIDYDENSDSLLLSVYYLELKEGGYYSDRDVLVMKFEDFIKSFAYWNNSKSNLDVTQAEWVPLNEIVVMP